MSSVMSVFVQIVYNVIHSLLVQIMFLLRCHLNTIMFLAGSRDPLRDLKNCRFAFVVTAIIFSLFALCVAIPVLQLQFLSFVLLSVGRCFLYSIVSAFITFTYVLINVNSSVMITCLHSYFESMKFVRYVQLLFNDFKVQPHISPVQSSLRSVVWGLNVVVTP